MRYREKPVVVEAFRWEDGESLPGWLCNAVALGRVEVVGGRLRIRTLEGEMEAAPGDWVIRGVKGELYPCKHDVFTATYEEAE